MKALTVDTEMLIQSMRDLCRETDDYFLDKNSGQVLGISRKLMRSLCLDTCEGRDALIPEWDAQMIPRAREIIFMGADHYVRVPEAFGRPEHQWMLEFSDTIRSLKLKEKIQLALRGRGSCRRFKEILKDHPEEINRWSVFARDRWEERIQRWLETQGILAVSAKSTRPRSAAA